MAIAAVLLFAHQLFDEFIIRVIVRQTVGTDEVQIVEFQVGTKHGLVTTGGFRIV